MVDSGRRTHARHDPETLGHNGHGDLRGGTDGAPWFVSTERDEVWVAVPQTSGGGGGWFRSSADLDPGSSGWEPVDPSEVLDHIHDDIDRAATLTARMLSSCLADGFGLEALQLAAALLDHGFDIVVSVAEHHHPAERPVLVGSS